MTFPSTYREISEMVPRVARHTQMARAIGRKAGLKEGSSAVGPTRIRTILDAWVIPSTTVLINQWSVDLTGFTRIKFSSQSLAEFVALYYSLSSSSEYDPGDWLPFAITTVAFQEEGPGGGRLSNRNMESLGEALFWGILPSELQGPMRLTVGYPYARFPTPYQIHPDIVDGPFNIYVEAF